MDEAAKMDYAPTSVSATIAKMYVSTAVFGPFTVGLVGYSGPAWCARLVRGH